MRLNHMTLSSGLENDSSAQRIYNVRKTCGMQILLKSKKSSSCYGERDRQFCHLAIKTACFDRAAP